MTFLRNLKDAAGRYVSEYAGVMSIGCDGVTVQVPANMAELLQPKYKGKIALRGDSTALSDAPAPGSAYLFGVVMAALASHGSVDNIGPGVEFLNKLSESGNLVPINPDGSTIEAGITPCVIDWLNQNAEWTDTLKGSIDWKVAIPGDAPPVTAYYVQAINKAAPHPAAARLWEEYLYSPEGQNIWLSGNVRPVLLAKMFEEGTIEQEWLGKLVATSRPEVALSSEEWTKAYNDLNANPISSPTPP